jgi:hypothetical protein
MYLPKGLIIVIFFLFVGFLVSMADALKHRIKTRRYRKVRSSGAGGRHMAHHPHLNTHTYQNSSEYALPPKQKVVTYCVIDGRLVDPSSMQDSGQLRKS